jgi:hypothetical protein
MEPKLFELEEANALIPRLEAAFARISVMRNEAGLLLEEMPNQKLPKEPPKDPALREKNERLTRLLEALRAEVQAIEALGGEIKDLDMGLVDFYGLREGKVVCLCWQHGEPEIMYWHEVEAGFAGRKPLSKESIAARRRLN